MKKQIQNYIEEVCYTLAGKRAVSMVIALALLSVILIVTLTSTYVLTNAIKGNTDLGGSIRAEYAANSAIELGLSAIRGKNPGWELASRENPMTFCVSPSGLSYTSISPQAASYVCPTAIENGKQVIRQKVQYWITSSAVDMGGGRYIVPPPGEGDAGENCERLDNYDDPQQRTNVLGVEENIKKPCNWNKLYLGQSVEIPLYTTNAAGNVINPPNLPDGFGSGLDSFTLKVRTPCADPMYDTDGYLRDTDNNGDAEEDEWCTNGSLSGPNARPELFDTTPGPGNPTDIIVHWQIIGDCDYSPNNSHDGQCIGLAVFTPSPPSPPTDNESDINITRINAGKIAIIPYAVLGNGTFPLRDKINDLKTTTPSDSSSILEILDYLTEPDNPILQFPPPNLTTTRTLTEPRLKLTVVSPMPTDSSGGQVSHIEYQLEVDQPIADSFWTVHGRGSYGNHSVTRKAKIGDPTSIINFVIQN